MVVSQNRATPSILPPNTRILITGTLKRYHQLCETPHGSRLAGDLWI